MVSLRPSRDGARVLLQRAHGPQATLSIVTMGADGPTGIRSARLRGEAAHTDNAEVYFSEWNVPRALRGSCFHVRQLHAFAALSHWAPNVARVSLSNSSSQRPGAAGAPSHHALIPPSAGRPHRGRPYGTGSGPLLPQGEGGITRALGDTPSLPAEGAKPPLHSSYVSFLPAWCTIIGATPPKLVFWGRVTFSTSKLLAASPNDTQACGGRQLGRRA